jgi:protocatechuate 3,4-dioxygenase beta subunit
MMAVIGDGDEGGRPEMTDATDAVDMADERVGVADEWVVTPIEPGTHPAPGWPDYRSTALRAPLTDPVAIPLTASERHGPAFGPAAVGELGHDLTRQHPGEPIGEPIIVHGRLLGRDGRPMRRSLVEVWQANAAGRYAHRVDQHHAPLDPNFTGSGACLTDDGGWYRFVTIKPGPYPWQNHPNAWRPAHIHFSVFGPAHATRLVTQMYFPGDPLFDHDPIFASVPAAARPRLVCALDLDACEPGERLAYRWDIVLRAAATPDLS